jgi:hypothetical protein
MKYAANVINIHKILYIHTHIKKITYINFVNHIFK